MGIESPYNTPGRSGQESFMYSEVTHIIDDVPVTVGVNTPAGEFYHFNEGERIQLIKLNKEDSDHTVFIKSVDGTLTPFNVWAERQG